MMICLNTAVFFSYLNFTRLDKVSVIRDETLPVLVTRYENKDPELLSFCVEHYLTHPKGEEF